MSSVSSTTLSVSTSSPSLVRDVMSPRNAPDATEAGYSFAKLRRPRMAARRSSRRVALVRRPLSVLIVSVAVCLGGALASSTRIILRKLGGLWLHGRGRGSDWVNVHANVCSICVRNHRISPASSFSQRDCRPHR